MDNLIFKPELFGSEMCIRPTDFYVNKYLPFINYLKENISSMTNFTISMSEVQINQEELLLLKDDIDLKNDFSFYNNESFDDLKNKYNSLINDFKYISEIESFINDFKHEILVEIKVVPENKFIPYKYVSDVFYLNTDIHKKTKYVKMKYFSYYLVDFLNQYIPKYSYLDNFSKNTLKRLNEFYCFDITNNLNLDNLVHGDIVKFNLNYCLVYYETINSFEKLKVYNSKKGLYITPKPSRKRIYLPLNKFNLYSDYIPSNYEKAKIFQDSGLINDKVNLNIDINMCISKINEYLNNEDINFLDDLLKILKQRSEYNQ